MQEKTRMIDFVNSENHSKLYDENYRKFLLIW